MKRPRKNTGRLIGLTLGLLGLMSYLAMPLPSLVNLSISGVYPTRLTGIPANRSALKGLAAPFDRCPVAVEHGQPQISLNLGPSGR
jgi:hypothetical protein